MNISFISFSILIAGSVPRRTFQSA